MAAKNALSALSPPADAPMPTTAGTSPEPRRRSAFLRVPGFAGAKKASLPGACSRLRPHYARIAWLNDERRGPDAAVSLLGGMAEALRVGRVKPELGDLRFQGGKRQAEARRRAGPGARPPPACRHHAGDVLLLDGRERAKALPRG